ncbi:hypothetical protein GF351_01660 [Candidatus Woesearchaeota archaeon]|nr:hypothetical protein [Candidatus Woesearchaeota archaeon]
MDRQDIKSQEKQGKHIRKRINDIYNELLRSFGSQGWWPTTPKGKTRPEYRGGPRSAKQRFEVIAGALLTQNTSWKNVEKALISLNKERLMDIHAIRNSRTSRLAALIRPAGYFNQKAERLKIAAACLDGRQLKKNSSLSREELLAFKGIGPETADSILLYAFGKPSFVVDAYTRRIMSRAGICSPDCSYDELQRIFHDNIPADGLSGAKASPKRTVSRKKGSAPKNHATMSMDSKQADDDRAKIFNEYHALLVELGKQYCTKNKPRCSSCPISRLCRKKNA